MKLGTVLLACVVLACNSSPNSSPPDPTLLVVNATCATGPCAPISVGAFPFTTPTTSSGMHIGTVASSSACLAIPPSYTNKVTDVSTGTTTTQTWSVSDPLGLTLGDSLGHSWATASFVPGTSSGWTVTVPPSQGLNPPVTPAAPCTPGTKSGVSGA